MSVKPLNSMWRQSSPGRGGGVYVVRYAVGLVGLFVYIAAGANLSLFVHDAPVYQVDLYGVTETNTYEFYFAVCLSNQHPWVLAESALPGNVGGVLVWTNAQRGWGRDVTEAFFRGGLADDSDGDGLSDGFERVVLKTDPDLVDTDGNGLADGDEDFDGDGMSNRREYNHPNKPGYVSAGGSSNPWHPDTDGDGICDGPCVPPGWSLAPGVDAFPLDPAGWQDTDGDGKTDALQGRSNSEPPLEEDSDGNKLLRNETFDVLSNNWSSVVLAGDAGSYGLVSGSMEMELTATDARFGICCDETVYGHFYVEVDFTNRGCVGLGLIQVNNGLPDTNNFTCITAGTNAYGQWVMRVRDRQLGVDDVLDNTSMFTADDRAQRYTHVLTNRYSVPYVRPAGKLRILRDHRSGFFHFYYTVRKQIHDEWAEGWMELAPSRCWGSVTQAYQAVLLMENESSGTAFARFDNLAIYRKQQNDQIDTQTGFQLREREYNWSGYHGDALVITFDEAFDYHEQDCKFVFWSQFNYVPSWQLSDRLHFSYEFCETWGGDNRGCHEPMSDRLLRWSKVNVIENNDVRKVVHWHYVLCNPDYKVPDDDQGTQLPEGDEYWTFYPDGSAVRHICYTPKLDTSFREWNEVAELMVIADSTSDPDQHIASPALTIMNLEGTWSKSFFPPVTVSYHDQAHEYNQFIIMAHFTNQIDAFTAFSHAEDIPETYSGYKLTTDITWHKPDYIMSHWPVGREPYATDNLTLGTWTSEVSHASLMGISAYNGYMEWTNNFKVDERGRKYRDWTALVALHSAGDLAGIREKTRSWLYPGTITMIGSNSVFDTIDYQRKSFVFTRTGALYRCHFQLDPTATGANVLYPAFDLQQWSATGIHVQADGAWLTPDEDYRYYANGTNMLLWIAATYDTTTEFLFTDSAP